MTPITVVIPTHQRNELLRRTLASLSTSRLPAAARRVVVAENGGTRDAGRVVAEFEGRLPVEHVFTSAANKSAALNGVLRAVGDGLVVFFDDDVRVHPDTLQAYASEVGSRTEGAFYGGECRVDYEEEPPAWLKPFLPPSVVGWSLGDGREVLEGPVALGCNWASFASDLRAAGGFDERKGPGTAARGQEHDMQSRLLIRGVTGYYVPGVVVWHFVPRERCSPEWALRRVEQDGVRDGLDVSRRVGHWEKVQWAAADRLRNVKAVVVMRLLGRFLPATDRFSREYLYRYRRGLLSGIAGRPRATG